MVSDTNTGAAPIVGRPQASQTKTLPQVALHPSRVALTLEYLLDWLRSPKPYLMLLGFGLMLAFWWLAVEVWKLPRFSNLPGLTTVVHEWLSQNPTFGVSIHTPDYYLHILTSLRRVAIAFALATAVGVPLGLMIGWSQTVREYVFPVFELLRPGCRLPF